MQTTSPPEAAANTSPAVANVALQKMKERTGMSPQVATSPNSNTGNVFAPQLAVASPFPSTQQQPLARRLSDELRDHGELHAENLPRLVANNPYPAAPPQPSPYFNSTINSSGGMPFNTTMTSTTTSTANYMMTQPPPPPPPSQLYSPMVTIHQNDTLPVAALPARGNLPPIQPTTTTTAVNQWPPGNTPNNPSYPIAPSWHQVGSAQAKASAMPPRPIPPPVAEEDPETLIIRYQWANGDVYEGQFKEGVMHGQGTYTYSKSNNRYIGEWMRGKKHGNGVFINMKKGETYEGFWKDGIREGFGVLTNTQENWKYVGRFEHNAIHGHGKLIDPSGEYEGNFENGKKSGVGRAVFKDGSVYEGYWSHGRQQGQGIFTCKEYIYNGGWENGMMHGFGECKVANGVIYRGNYVRGKRCGEGEEIMPDGTRFKGMFRDDVRDGEGTFYYANGDRCFGSWRENNMIGAGIFTYRNGKSQKVVYREGRCLKI